MSLGVVSPIRNKGLYSDWLSAAPVATSMLTIDTSGNVGSQSIPVAAWGSITGTLSNQTDLQNALNAKLSLSGGTMTGNLTAPVGSSSSPSINFGSNTGMYSAGAGFVNFAAGASTMMQMNIDAGQFWISNNTATAQIALGTSADVRLFRDAANTLAQRNSTNAQIFRIYNTFTDTSNYERAKIAWSSNVLQIGTEKAGTGTARALELQTDGTTRLMVDTGGNTTINTDVSTGSTPLTLKYNSTTMFSFNYTGTFNCGLTGNEGLINLNSGYGYITTVGSSATTRHLQLRSFNGINLDIGGLGGSGLKLLTFGGVTSSFPALKRSTTNIEVRLADDSGFATIKGKLATDTNYTAGAPTATGYIVLYDAAGTAYKIPAEAL